MLSDFVLLFYNNKINIIYVKKQKFKDLDTALINESTSQSDSDSNSIEEIESKSSKSLLIAHEYNS